MNKPLNKYIRGFTIVGHKMDTKTNTLDVYWVSYAFNESTNAYTNVQTFKSSLRKRCSCFGTSYKLLRVSAVNLSMTNRTIVYEVFDEYVKKEAESLLYDVETNYQYVKNYNHLTRTSRWCC